MIIILYYIDYHSYYNYNYSRCNNDYYIKLYKLLFSLNSFNISLNYYYYIILFYNYIIL